MNREDLLRDFDYDPHTGILRWKLSHKISLWGAVAGSATKGGGISIVWRGERFSRGQLVWFLHTGELPIDHGKRVRHKDGDNANDRFDNLYLQNAAKPK